LGRAEPEPAGIEFGIGKVLAAVLFVMCQAVERGRQLDQIGVD
jgi:hypothetical protein